MTTAVLNPLFRDDGAAEPPTGNMAPVREGRYRFQALVALAGVSTLMWAGIIALVVHFVR